MNCANQTMHCDLDICWSSHIACGYFDSRNACLLGGRQSWLWWDPTGQQKPTGRRSNPFGWCGWEGGRSSGIGPRRQQWGRIYQQLCWWPKETAKYGRKRLRRPSPCPCGSSRPWKEGRKGPLNLPQRDEQDKQNWASRCPCGRRT